MTKKRLTLSDIAELSGVSKTTVSMILNGRGNDFRIKSETCQKVKEIAKNTVIVLMYMQNHYRLNARM